ncbi:bacteriohemerythrin [Anaeromyxobacter terrae]|uniref:bacteriohemerythrin n=1 Tax=Anaeromyxobacter terrae TaxID=2925406 RepID=UPI001F583F46|nr:bacteriohemerythrin [Anaeromyxobacter sp. SG22]
MAIQWTHALAVGVSEIDAQHQELFLRAARVVDALDAGERADVVELVQYLHGHAVTHFGLEETWMRETRYPGFVRHKAEHDRFVADLAQIAGELARGQGAVPFRVGRWLAEWLETHVGQSDLELGRYLARRSA